MDGPRRTCVSCRLTAPARDLVRITWPPIAAGPVVSSTSVHVVSGRGAWVHPEASCVSRLGTQCLSRALRRTVTVSQVADVVEVLSRERCALVSDK